ncbi:MAG: hypothetical protein ABGX22_06290 [Pirellulaceae bacterium]|nr:hypothetical protein [Planctomycetaceae bacterium]
MIYRLIGSVLVVTAIGCFGCSGPTNDDSAGQDPITDNHDNHDNHDHHDHDHSSGPHDGHILELGDEEFHAEWLHDDDSGQLTVYILDAEMKSVVAAKSVTIITQVQGQDAKSYTLGKSTIDDETVFELKDISLVEALKIVSEGVTAKLNVKIGEQSFEQEFEEHSGHDH